MGNLSFSVGFCRWTRTCKTIYDENPIFKKNWSYKISSNIFNILKLNATDRWKYIKRTIYNDEANIYVAYAMHFNYSNQEGNWVYIQKYLLTSLQKADMVLFGEALRDGRYGS